jgi:hypothetical protein
VEERKLQILREEVYLQEKLLDLNLKNVSAHNQLTSMAKASNVPDDSRSVSSFAPSYVSNGSVSNRSVSNRRGCKNETDPTESVSKIFLAAIRKSLGIETRNNKVGKPESVCSRHNKAIFGEGAFFSVAGKGFTLNYPVAGLGDMYRVYHTPDLVDKLKSSLDRIRSKIATDPQKPVIPPHEPYSRENPVPNDLVVQLIKYFVAKIDPTGSCMLPDYGNNSKIASSTVTASGSNSALSAVSSGTSWIPRQKLDK